MAEVHDGRLLELVGELGGEPVRDLFRDLLERSLQELVDAELAEAIGAEPHERTDTRTNQRNGGRPRMLSTPAGDVELRLPKVRTGSFFPSLLEPRRRVEFPRFPGRVGFVDHATAWSGVWWASNWMGLR